MGDLVGHLRSYSDLSGLGSESLCPRDMERLPLGTLQQLLDVMMTVARLPRFHGTSLR